MIDPSKPAPFELAYWDLVERTGWTLEYIDALKLDKLHELAQVDDGRTKARNSLFNKR